MKMARLVVLCLCLGSLFVIACAYPSDDPLSPDSISRTNNNRRSQFSKKKAVDLTPSFYRKKEKPVNELFPHAVLFGRICGGTIISPNWILTAAHCTINSAGKVVVAGTNNTSSDGGGVFRVVKRRIIHPLFSVGPYWLNTKSYSINQVSAHYDFMLVELIEPLKIDNVTIAVAKLNENLELPSGMNVAYAGYGSTEHGGIMSKNMHERKLQLLSEDKCKVLKEYSSTDMICAIGRPPNYDSACNGDSGSGLVDENRVLVGILSWAENDARFCQNRSIVYFSKVAEVREWIRDVANV